MSETKWTPGRWSVRLAHGAAESALAEARGETAMTSLDRIGASAAAIKPTDDFQLALTKFVAAYESCEEYGAPSLRAACLRIVADQLDQENGVYYNHAAKRYINIADEAATQELLAGRAA